MKILKYIVLFCGVAILSAACQEGYIDPVKPLAPGQDLEPPAVTISSPVNGYQIKVKEELGTIRIMGEVRDDIELESVTITLNGLQIYNFTQFVDFRRLVLDVTYVQVPNGINTLTVSARDRSGKTTSQSIEFEKVEPYNPVYDGEIFYMPFESSFAELVSTVEATRVGNVGFAADGKFGSAFAGASDGYITFPAQNAAEGINLLNSEFSATFWYKINATPDRAGILTIMPAPVAPATSGSRQFGIRFFREGGATNQKFNMNVGTVNASGGAADAWCDGGAAATVNPAETDWLFLSFTISETELAVYIDGVQVQRVTFNGIRWGTTTTLSIMSGAPNFVEWNHFSDLSLMDELRIFNKALTQQEIQTIMNDALQ